ncbi:hypothetical protein AB0I28_12480 [Phytomonospora sp. NPDC050363]|uniref:hypothetical protein n=1 Tax=Phytomonospora sp. NPDC050363 TaxID=3155642 RepID=UPI0034060672
MGADWDAALRNRLAYDMAKRDEERIEGITALADEVGFDRDDMTRDELLELARWIEGEDVDE